MEYSGWHEDREYGAALKRTKFQFSIPIDASNISFDTTLQCYILASTQGMWSGSWTNRHVFDSLGQPVTEDQWSLFATETLTAGAAQTGLIGDYTQPPWGLDPDNEPQAPDGVNNSSRGWNVGDWDYYVDGEAFSAWGLVAIATFDFDYSGDA